MSKRSQQESLLLGAVVGAIAGLAIALAVILLVDFGNDEVGSTDSASAPTTTVAVQGTAGPGAGQGQAAGQGQGGGGPGQGAGNGQGGGPPPGAGPGSHQDGEQGDPLSFGTASQDVLDAFTAGGCVACHTIKGVGGGAASIGPGLSRVGEVGGIRVPGMSAEAYIEQSILDPGAFVRPNCPNGPCPEGIMPQTYAETLTADQISTIVGYLAALGTAAEPDVLTAPAA
jgi:hypothetical protein